MIIQLLESKPGGKRVAAMIEKWFEKSRFNIGSIYPRTMNRATPHRFKGGDIILERIRLKKPKHFHGFGPIQRRVSMRKGWNRSAPAKPAKLRFLEGADWIDFNDLLNDFMDHFKICSDIKSARCIIRKGFKRRIRYDGEPVPRSGSSNTFFGCESEGARQWKRTEGNDGFIDSRVDYLIPFSTTTEDEVAGSYRMFGSPLTT